VKHFLACLGFVLSVASLAPGGVAAQVLDGEPIVFGGGRVTIGGDVSATFGCSSGATAEDRCGDDLGFFNFTDYEHSTLQLLRVDLAAEVRATDRLAVLAEVRSENAGTPQPYALFLRVRPWPARRFDIQAGRIPPTFGGFARRTYPTDNLLIGYPLAYQYLISLRPDSLPANADELLRMRGRGWLSSFTVGNREPSHGMPLISAFRWDTGVQLHAANDVVEGALAVTTGTLGNPLVRDDNDGKQVVGRLVARPLEGLVIGGSGARGPYASDEAAEAAGLILPIGTLTQTTWGADIEYSRDYYLVRYEAILSRWHAPRLQEPAITEPLAAFSSSIEGRYKIRTGLYAAARLDHLDFSEITGTARRTDWEAPVTRFEIGGGYSVMRNLLVKLAFQRNTRPGTRTTSLNFVAAQAVFWF
jgi:hypothetical protein